MATETDRLDKIHYLRTAWTVSLLLLALLVILFHLLPWPLVVRQTIVLVGIALYGIATLLVVFSRCPRCGHLFHNVLGFRNPLSGSCSHCGLSLRRK